jgi:hypothetical protein
MSKLIWGFQSGEPYNNGFVEGDTVYIGINSQGPAAHVYLKSRTVILAQAPSV